MFNKPVRHRQSNKRRQPAAITAAALSAVSLLCASCGSPASSLFVLPENDRTVRVVIEDNPQVRTESSVLSVKAGSDLQFLITPAERCTVRGTDYRDYTLDRTEDGQYICTLHDIRYDTVVTILTQENPYTIRYEINGGTSVAADSLSGSYAEFSYPASHLRVNTEQGTNLFMREGFLLTGWNTAADGTGQHIGLGSRVKAESGRTLTLYAEWAPVNDPSDFLYEKGTNSVTITGFRRQEDITAAASGSRDIVIPPEIDGLPVTGIGQGAFRDAVCDCVILPPTVKVVNVHAFDNCTLRELTLFDGISQITDYAFSGCENLRTIHINACVPPVYSGSYYDTFPDKIQLRQCICIGEHAHIYDCIVREGIVQKGAVIPETGG